MICKARGKTLDIKLQIRWKYNDTLCSGCKVNENSVDDMLGFGSFGESSEKISYSLFYSNEVLDQISVGKVMMKKLKAKEKMIEEIT